MALAITPIQRRKKIQGVKKAIKRTILGINEKLVLIAILIADLVLAIVYPSWGFFSISIVYIIMYFLDKILRRSKRSNK